MIFHFALLIDPAGKVHDLVFVAYKFDGVPKHTILVRPHGNCKVNKPFCRIMESTKNQLTTKLESQPLQTAISTVFHSKGGIVEAKSVGKLRCSQHQAYYLKRKLQQKEIIQYSPV